MKRIADMSGEEVAAWVCNALGDAGIVVTLSGGGCVAIWSEGKYVSDDLDLIEEGPVSRRRVRDVMQRLGFTENGRNFEHPQTKYFVEFPTGPLMVGDQRVHDVSQRNTSVGKLRLLSPTDCVKDRLAAFFHWNDRQSLQQALFVATAQDIDLRDVANWSRSEGKKTGFAVFAKMLAAAKRDKNVAKGDRSNSARDSPKDVKGGSRKRKGKS